MGRGKPDVASASVNTAYVLGHGRRFWSGPISNEQLIRVISLTCIYWTPHSKLEQWRDKKGNLLDCVWCIIYPLFSEKGKDEYYNQIRNDG
jgi:hypothetical protein